MQSNNFYADASLGTNEMYVYDMVAEKYIIENLSSATDAEIIAAIQAALIKPTRTVGRCLTGIVDVRCIIVDLSYQRTATAPDIGKFVGKYDQEKTMPVLLGYRDGHLYVIDGGHRLFGAIEAGIKLIEAHILLDTTREEEAELFRYQDNARSNIKPQEALRAGCVYGNNPDITLVNVCHDYSLTPYSSRDTGLTRMTAIKACIDVLTRPDRDGEATLRWIFSIMRDANWLVSEVKNATTSNHIYAFEKALIIVENENIDIDAATERLVILASGLSPDDLDVAAKHAYDEFDLRQATKTLLVNVAVGNIDPNTFADAFKDIARLTKQQEAAARAARKQTAVSAKTRRKPEKH